MMGPFTEGDIVHFEQSIKAFEEKTGIDIQYEGTKEFEATIGVRVDAGDVPDIVDFPQPGLLAAFFKQGKFIDPTTFLPAGLPEAAIQPGLAGHGHDGRRRWPRHRRHLGALQRQEPGVVSRRTTSMRPATQIPTTWEELIALSDQIVADGDTPLVRRHRVRCGHRLAGDRLDGRVHAAHHHPGELRQVGQGRAEVRLPRSAEALQKLSELWLKEGYVYGGQEAIATTFFGDAPAPMFEQPAQVLAAQAGQLHHQLLPRGCAVWRGL